MIRIKFDANVYIHDICIKIGHRSAKNDSGAKKFKPDEGTKVKTSLIGACPRKRETADFPSLPVTKFAASGHVVSSCTSQRMGKNLGNLWQKSSNKKSYTETKFLLHSTF
jgi:hypothetical protein